MEGHGEENTNIERIEKRILLGETENDYNLAVHKRENFVITAGVYLMAFSAAIVAIIDLFLGCGCGLDLNEDIMLVVKLINFVMIVCTFGYSIIGENFKRFIRKTKRDSEKEPDGDTDSKIVYYLNAIEKEKRKLHLLKFVYTVICCVIAFTEAMLIIFAVAL